MKRFALLLSALSILIAPPLFAEGEEEVPLQTETFALPDAPFREREEPQGLSDGAKTVIAVAGTLITITLGLFLSGRDTGKHIQPRALRESSS
ncbi:MAG: hypothetical protein KDK60_03885 [Chlamydiia bacterium]|nr:hypothetical protein [Chlamydiia bacterium]